MAEPDEAARQALWDSLVLESEALKAAFGPAAGEDGPVELKPLKIMPPPPMTWVLVGIPTVRFGEINQQVEAFAGIDGIILETTSNDG